jgi:hypothetical protein
VCLGGDFRLGWVQEPLSAVQGRLRFELDGRSRRVLQSMIRMLRRGIFVHMAFMELKCSFDPLCVGNEPLHSK